jgi:spermidine synthase
MIPWALIDKAPIPDGGGELTLHRRGKEFSIRVNGKELMNSRVHGSEEMLAELTARQIGDRPGSSVLIGGLGMGYTTAAALQQFGPGTRIVVAEIVPAVVEWNKGPLADLAGRPLDDPRILIRETDIAWVLKQEKQAYDAILLDVDNGPDGLTRKDNSWLYSPDGLKAAYSALRPSGVLAVWSSAPDAAFTRRLEKTKFTVTEHRTRARSTNKGGLHTLWLALRTP